MSLDTYIKDLPSKLKFKLLLHEWIELKLIHMYKPCFWFYKFVVFFFEILVFHAADLKQVAFWFNYYYAKYIFEDMAVAVKIVKYQLSLSIFYVKNQHGLLNKNFVN